ncbi:hypothetical protein [Tepidiforma sp.]|uniref:hypothetical protein n=1 Tax=Tepidiforma sp. TaxID=2682230 RepID=UPI002ADD341A|nr:hypothetical protein [Tepidiforma sp.]
MRNALFGLSVALAGMAQLVSTLLFLAAWLGGAAWLFLSGSVIWTTLWFIFGPALLVVGISVLRLPVILLGLLLAALAGRRDDYLAAVAAMNSD